MEKLNKTNVKKMLLIDEKFNSLLDECRTAIKQAFINIGDSDEMTIDGVTISYTVERGIGVSFKIEKQ